MRVRVRVRAVLLHVVDGGVHLQLMVALLLLLLRMLLKLLQRSLLLKVVTLGVDLRLLVFYAAFLCLLGGYGGYGNRDGHLTRDELVVWGGGGGTQGTEALCGGAEFTVT